MKLFICIDDTDSLESRGTGSIAEELCGLIEKEGWGTCGEITRHQLLLHEDVPYTSHNSSMCFPCEVVEDCRELMIPALYAYLERESAPGSDPGIAVSGPLHSPHHREALLHFGLSAKRLVLTKAQAYTLAEQTGVYLAEAGGTGQGVIGALAGLGLRMGGNDGEVKGQIKGFQSGAVYTVEQMKAGGRISAVCDMDRNRLADSEQVRIAWKAKPLMVDHRPVLLVRPSLEDGVWSTMEKDEMRRYGDLRSLSAGCGRFVADVEEERVSGAERSCLNCRFRRWTETGFQCTVPPQRVDVAVVGAGVVGAFVARHLVQSTLSVAILEKNSDVCDEVTKANTAIVHCGYSGKPGSLKAGMTVRANENFQTVCDELQVEFLRCGSLMLVSGEKGMDKLREKVQRGEKNGVKGLRILSRDEALAMEPNLNPNITAALYAPTTGVVNPWEFGLAAVENAVDNGARLHLNTKVTEIVPCDNGYRLTTTQGPFLARYVINCGGLYSDEISNMVAEPYFQIKPRRGEYFLLDTAAGGLVERVIFQSREDETKGVIVAPTVHGNILVGPSAVDVADKADTATDAQKLEQLKQVSRGSVPHIPFDLVIRSFAGVRPRPAWIITDGESGEITAYEDDVKDFIIGEPDGCPNFINVAGIKSPGLTCGDEIGKYVAEMVFGKETTLTYNASWNPRRRERIRFAQLPAEEQQALAQKDRNYAQIICRCRKVTKAEILDAIRRNAGAVSVDGVKRRAGTCLGRCQGSFCTSEIIHILREELGLEAAEVDKDQQGSPIVTGYAQ